MDLKIVQRLVRMMERADLSEVEIDDKNEGLRVHLKRGRDSHPPGPAPLVHVVPQVGVPAPTPSLAAPSPAQADAEVEEGGGVPFPSPMVGTFYRSPSPDADPFVTEGSEVAEDAVVCIIEAMKVMNEIKAEMRGRILQVLVENGEPVEFGQPLFLVQPL